MPECMRCGMSIHVLEGHEFIEGEDFCLTCLTQEVVELRDENALLCRSWKQLRGVVQSIDESWSREGWTPENAKARTCFTEDTIERWKQARAALVEAAKLDPPSPGEGAIA